MSSVASTDSIVFTGAGAVCGAGLSPEEIFEAVVAGRSAISAMGTWDASKWAVTVAADVKGVDNRKLVEDRKLHKLLSRTDLFGIYAGDSAVKSSGLAAVRQALPASDVAHFNDRSGVYVGSGGGTYQSSYDFYPAFTAAGGSLPAFGGEAMTSVNPMWLLKNLPNNVLCHVGIRNSLKGPNACIMNQCVSGSLAVAEAAAGIREGEADRSVAIGHDAPIEPETVLYYHRFGLLDTEALRPFDRRRRGTVFGEGAAGLVLERAPDAGKRGAAVLGEYLGFGCVSEATGIVDVRPDGDGVRRAIQIALADANLKPEQVGMIVAHGNGTRASDASEAAAIRAVFGANPPPVTGFKWCIGHAIAASGLLDLTLALLALRKNIVPGIPTLAEVDPELSPLPVSAQAQPPRTNIALVVCRGFAGMNVAILVRAGDPLAR